jgi:hypothetical protein
MHACSLSQGFSISSFNRAELEPDSKLGWIVGSARDSVNVEVDAIGSLELG